MDRVLMTVLCALTMAVIAFAVWFLMLPPTYPTAWM